MNLYDRLGVRRIVNAADSYTVIGGSLMPAEVLDAMAEAARSFVSIEALHDAVGLRLAELTRNEAAMVTSGAAAALAIATAACMTGMDEEAVRRIPHPGAGRNEVIVHRCQDNGFLHAVRQAGADIRWLGDRSDGSAAELESLLSERTACLLYFVSPRFERDALPLEEAIAACRRRGVPVVVDAAAQLPPVSNLWAYTRMGADLVIFSGGKTLRGPQSSGLILGSKSLVRACRLNASPNVAIGRTMKVGKEEMAGLLAAVERYVHLDHERENAELERLTELICRKAEDLGLQAERRFPGPTGQSYPRAFIRLGPESAFTADGVREALERENPSIWVTAAEDGEGIFVNPLHLREEEISLIFERLGELFQSVEKR